MQYESMHITDHTGNGQPEIEMITLSGGSICWTEFVLYEWHDGRFVNVAANVESMASDWRYARHDCGKWQTEAPNTTGAKLLIAHQLHNTWGGKGCDAYDSDIVYQWTGSQYQRTGVKRVRPFDNVASLNCAVGWADVAVNDGRYDEAVPLLEAAPKAWPMELDEIWGPSAQDFFHFKLGTWYATQGRSEFARETLQQVRDHPNNPQYTLSSQLADTYLSVYQNTNSPVAACNAAHRIAEKTLSMIPHPTCKVCDAKAVIQLWGFAPPPWADAQFADLDDICNLTESFRQSVRQLVPNTQAELITWLRQHRIPVWSVTRGDLTGDGTDDWIVVVKLDQDEYSSWQLWALLRDKSETNTVQLYQTFQLQGSYFTTLRREHSTKREQEVNVFTLGNLSLEFRVVPSQSPASPSLDYWVDLVEFKRPQPSPRTRWYEEPDYKQQAKVVDQIENTIFNTVTPSQAITPLQILLSNTTALNQITLNLVDHPNKSYLLYLLALTYELSGDERNAVQTYWQLWQQYPNSYYTLIARRKLQLK
jgi:tetratricopeptide (TPR) repeat protein